MNDQMSACTQRIVRIMQDKNMNPTQFSEAIGIQRAAMSHITSGRNNPSADVITKIVERFEDINPGWLLTGKGTMKNSSNNQSGGLFGETAPPSGHRNQSNPPSERKNQSDSPSNRTISFDDKPVRTEKRPPDEISEREEVSQPNTSDKVIEKEIIIYKEKPPKTIDKLLIFYSDHTYETFHPE